MLIQLVASFHSGSVISSHVASDDVDDSCWGVHHSVEHSVGEPQAFTIQGHITAVDRTVAEPGSHAGTVADVSEVVTISGHAMFGAWLAPVNGTIAVIAGRACGGHQQHEGCKGRKWYVGFHNRLSFAPGFVGMAGETFVCRLPF